MWTGKHSAFRGRGVQEEDKGESLPNHSNIISEGTSRVEASTIS